MRRHRAAGANMQAHTQIRNYGDADINRKTEISRHRVTDTNTQTHRHTRRDTDTEP